MLNPTAYLLAIASAAFVAGPALAQTAATPLAADAQISAQASSQIDAVQGGALFEAEAISETALQAIAGREDINQMSQANLRAGVSQNSVGDNAVTGAASIDGNAFQNMSGLSILNVNTGNNVAINAAMNVNISITPVP